MTKEKEQIFGTRRRPHAEPNPTMPKCPFAPVEPIISPVLSICYGTAIPLIHHKIPYTSVCFYYSFIIFYLVLFYTPACTTQLFQIDDAGLCHYGRCDKLSPFLLCPWNLFAGMAHGTRSTLLRRAINQMAEFGNNKAGTRGSGFEGFLCYVWLIPVEL